MTAHPTISVIILTFRRPVLLKRAIDSVLEQSYPDFHIVIYDDASQDETREVVKQYRDERIKYYEHPKNIGLNKNYSFSLERVDAPFFVFLSDDDVFMPTFLEEAVKGFQQYPEAGVFIGGMIYMDIKKRLMGAAVHEWMTKPYYCPKEIVQEIIQGRFAGLINTMVFRKEVRDVASFNDKIWLDVDFVTRILLRFSVILSPVSCMIYQLHSNVSHGANICEYWNMKTTVRDMILDSGLILPDEKKEAEQAMNDETRRFIYSMAYQRFVTRRFKESVQGIELLEKHFSLNGREKIIKWCAYILIRFPFLTYFFAMLVHIWRSGMRFFHFRRIKMKIGNENYQAFTKIVSRI